MLEIKFDVTTLNAEERHDLASFILGFPQRVGKPLTGTGGVTLPNGNDEGVDRELLWIMNPSASKGPQPFSPESPPLPEGASAAPISAGAEVSSIVPEVIPETILTNPIVNIPPVPPNANAAGVAAPPQINPVELDSEGLPWDKRIHSSAKTKIASGAWKLARGIEPNVVEAVKAELRALMATPVVAGELVPPLPSIDLPENAVPTPPAPAPASHYLMTPIRHGFVDFIEDITKLLVSKKLAQPEIIKACNDAGVAAPNLLAARQDLIPQVAKALTDIVASRI